MYGYIRIAASAHRRGIAAYSSLFVTKKVQRRTLASGTYPNALPLVLPSAALGVVRAPPPVTVALRTRPSPVMPRSQPAPLPGRAVQCNVRPLGGARTATLGLAHPLQAAMWGVVPGQLAAGGLASSPVWAQLASQISIYHFRMEVEEVYF